MIQYYPVITNAGSPYGFTVFEKTTRDVQVLPSSAATFRIAFDGPARLTTPAIRARWRAAGRPALPRVPAKPLTVQLPAGAFSFVPQGRVLTYRAAASLPTSAAAVGGRIRAMLGDRPSPSQTLTQLGYLLGSAPLTAAGRSATWMAVATLPGLRLCPRATDLAGRRGTVMCLADGEHQAELVTDPAARSVLAVQDRLLRKSANYPGVSPGTLLQSATFIAGS